MISYYIGGDDTMDYLIRGIDKELWKKARIKAIQEDLPMPKVMRGLIEAWVKGEVQLTQKRKRDNYGPYRIV
jgi:hypothetical protein